MASAKEMQGVPAHLTYLKAKGNRRHPAHCKHHEGAGKERICMNTLSPLYQRRCSSAAKCDYYDE